MPSATQDLLDWVLLSPQRRELDVKEWDAVIAQSVAHTVAPQLYRSLASERVPADVLQAAAIAMMWQKQHSARIQRDLSAMLSVLNAAGIAPILLKGAHLAAFVYGDPADRPMGDIDILVHFDEASAAEKAFVAVGYEPERSARTRQIRLTKRDATPVEVHWGITKERDQTAVDHDSLWQRSREVSVCVQKARVFSPEDLLLHVSLHAGISHQFGEKGLRPLFDVLAILGRYGDALDWPAIEQRAMEWRIERATNLMLELARREGGARLPAANVSSRVYDAARAQMFEAPGLNVYPVAPYSIGAAWVNPRGTLTHLFRKDNRKEETLGAEVGGYVSRYTRFLWHCLLHDRGRLRVIFMRARRHVVLSTWLANERSAVKP